MLLSVIRYRRLGDTMTTPDPWTFGWSQLLTIVGFAITICIAFGGFRTFGRWKREKLEEKRMEIAIEALALAYQAKYVFQNIRGPFIPVTEWKDMPRLPEETDNDWNRRGSFYAIIQRINDNKEFFQNIWAIQPRFMAIFGPESEAIFMLIHEARRFIVVSVQTLALRRASGVRRRPEQGQSIVDRAEADIWDGSANAHEVPDRVGIQIDDFRTKIEALCRPIIDRSFRRGK
jgi:hypothetical protein